MVPVIHLNGGKDMESDLYSTNKGPRGHRTKNGYILLLSQKKRNGEGIL